MLRLVLCLAALGGSGCASFGTLQTADTLGRGHYQLALEPAYQFRFNPGGVLSGARGDLAGRYGVTDRIDVGGRVGSSGVELDGKLQLTPSDGVIVSLAPQVGGAPNGSSAGYGGSVNAALPVLVGFPLWRTSQLVLSVGPQEAYTFVKFADVQARLSVLGVRATVGWAQVLSRHLRVLVELGGEQAVSTWSDFPLSAGSTPPAFQLGAAVMWGG